MLQAPMAADILAQATDLVGYAPYLARVPSRPQLHTRGQVRHSSDNGSEMERARLALCLAQSGRNVAVVSGGDPGVFAMASAVFEAIEYGPSEWRALDVHVIPGISALLAVAAKVGAPLGGDFCAISLSDNRKPWEVVTRRLALAAEAEFAIALYNVRSVARPWQLDAALDLLRQALPGETPVVFARAVSRQAEDVSIVPLSQAAADHADMRSLVLIGSRHTRWISRPGGGHWVYTPRTVS
jgi:precorrin-3B C17-methyltransferase